MTGSRRWFRYIADDGQAFGINADESNTELVNSSALTAQSVAGLRPLPKGYTARQVTLSNLSRTITRTCYVLNQTTYNGINGATNFQLTPENFSGVSSVTEVSPILKTPELIRRQPIDGDSGLNDGDVP